jgi:hypothetical protein
VQSSTIQAAAICVGVVLCQVCTVVASSVYKNLTVTLFVLLPKVLPNFIYNTAREKGFPKITFVQKNIFNICFIKLLHFVQHSQNRFDIFQYFNKEPPSQTTHIQAVTYTFSKHAI